MEKLPALQEKAISLRDYLNRDNIKGALQSALPKWLSVDRLLRIVFTSTMKNPKLLDCTLESLLQSIMQCAQLGLEPILGRAYLIPYNNTKQIDGKWKKVLECQFQPGYQGLVDLARRSGQVKDVFAMVVYENDEFDLEYGTNRRLVHKPFLGEDPGEPLGAYTVWELSDGTKTFEFMPLHEIYKRRDRSQAYQYATRNPDNKTAQECPWIQWAEEQMKKTVVKHHAKLQPASIEVMQAAELDEAADLGRSQLGMFTDSPVYGALPTSEPDILDTSEFNKLVNQYLDYPPDATLDKAINLMAGRNEMTTDEFKVEAAKDFDNFWKMFEAWRLKTYPEDKEDPLPSELKRATDEEKAMWRAETEDFLCKHCGKSIHPTLKGLRKHITQQHPFETKKAKDHFDGKKPEIVSETPEAETELQQGETTSEDDFNEAAEKAAKIKAIRQGHPDYLIQAQESLSLVTYQLEELPLDTLQIILDKCKELANDKPF